MAKSISQKEDIRQSDKELFRLFLLDALFQEEKFYSKGELCARLEVSVATLNRDLSRLRDKYRAPLEFSHEHNGYHYTSQLYKLPAVFVSEDEMPAYSMVSKLFEMFQNTPLYRPLINLCETFESPVKSEFIDINQMNFKSSELPEKQWFETRIVMAKREVDSVDDDVWAVILCALKNNFVLQFDYESVGENRVTKSRTLEPWQLIFDREQWYLRGISENGKDYSEKGVRTFVISRMRNLALTTQHFNLPPEKEWMLDKYKIGSFGLQIAGKPVMCKFIFQGSALYYSNALFSSDKKIEPYTGTLTHKEGAVLVSFTSNQWPAILRDFFAYGADIIPLEPKALVDEWKNKIREMQSYL